MGPKSIDLRPREASRPLGFSGGRKTGLMNPHPVLLDDCRLKFAYSDNARLPILTKIIAAVPNTLDRIPPRAREGMESGSFFPPTPGHHGLVAPSRPAADLSGAPKASWRHLGTGSELYLDSSSPNSHFLTCSVTATSRASSTRSRYRADISLPLAAWPMIACTADRSRAPSATVWNVWLML